MTDLPDVPGESQATAFVVASPEQALQPDPPPSEGAELRQTAEPAANGE
jgi:hypothetical protein